VFNATLGASDTSTNLQPYIDAKSRYLQAKRYYDAAQMSFSKALLKEDLSAEPVKIWEMATAPADPLPFSFERFKYALRR
jgi:hypothetical protein